MLDSMVDIHCHLLPGLDDGPDSMEEAVQMAEMAIEDGITHVVATPHANDRYAFVPETIQKRRDEIQERVGNRLQVATGCDFHLSFENMEDIRREPAKYTIHQKNYLLVEFADFSIPPSMDDTLHQLQLLGLNPIVTHPERNGLLRGDPKRLEGWLRRGCYAQVTAQSLLGRFGDAARHWAETWLDQGWVQFVATDAHSTKSRPPRLREAYDVVAARRGEEVARALFHDNPLAAFEGRPLPFVPEPSDAATSGSPKRRKRFFFF
jgi:protein-tyrosine phosphatase